MSAEQGETGVAARRRVHAHGCMCHLPPLRTDIRRAVLVYVRRLRPRAHVHGFVPAGAPPVPNHPRLRLVVPSGPRTVAVTKHLCGGATDSSLRTLVAGELGERIGGVVLAPCCHQKCRFAEYCALRWLQESGFCTTHRGVRGGEECNDWKT